MFARQWRVQQPHIGTVWAAGSPVLRGHPLAHKQQIGQYEDVTAFLSDFYSGRPGYELHDHINRSLQLTSIMQAWRRNLKLDLLSWNGIMSNAIFRK